jgi:hypothetical protein
LIFTLEGVQDFDFSINIDAFDKNNVYLSYIASSTKYTKDTHERVTGPGIYGVRNRLPDDFQLNSMSDDINTYNENLNGAELRGVNFDIKVRGGITLDEVGQLTTNYTNARPT